ncbi:MAG: hypothetical protein A3A82_00405 [Candidatus Pacebacteria bacterium RIFCSPLOWO2_01_FULL_47_12]|nr:MAG: hypothetical protein A3A82_00405 [Candidatus Pacebacteria bacterium RIFCSPLOWO2_01_FULL_47_12]
MKSVAASWLSSAIDDFEGTLSMDLRQIKQPLKLFISALPKAVKLSQVIVFGSRGDGTALKDSDIDVIVVSDYFLDISEDNRLDVLYKASRFISPEIHPWGVTPEELSKADKQSTLGAARESGKQFV